jgi:aminoglycoside phosphotransferase (APT) family kinase protein
VSGGWETFAALAPPDVGDAVLALLKDPRPLVDALEETEMTMLHADVHFDNAVLEPNRLVLIDWTLATQGPPAVDVVWFIDQSIDLLDAKHDEVVEEFLRAEGGRVGRDEVDLAILSELLSSGWQCRDWIDTAQRAKRQASFDWFVAGARRGLASL